ncbi:hypothetical protein ABZ490_14025 [Streptomyces sp. NPDC005811]|uniref:hypothetical protein n=1 Tax=Streptomyces sp. NPDC005811 TaxID=3154565 RepID=UPI00340CB3EE
MIREPARRRADGSEGSDLDTKHRSFRRESYGRSAVSWHGTTHLQGTRHFRAVLRGQRRYTGQGYNGALWGLSQHAIGTGVMLSVPGMALKALAHALRRHGASKAFPPGIGLKVNADRRGVCTGGEVTHRVLGAAGVQVQHTEQEKAQTQHTPQSR